ncbi:MAG TPA: DUF2914 domain-containing protein [Vicinamibacterales bacterium]|jgi:hypothetical protein|nr:DUF2914 domain-containing protein [Vicinamibacterales bacterium]
MPQPREARLIIENAEQAAAAGDYSSAEELLREAAARQEQTLGPEHPDLANTLNNLGVVCEMADNPIDAEHYFRRAYTIATETLAPDHPFVVTSRKNLHDFCAARGRPMVLRPSPPEVAAWLEAPAHGAAPPHESSPSAKKQDVTPIPRKRSLRPFALGALGGVALLIVILTMTWPWGSGAQETKSPPATAIAPAGETSAPRTTPPQAEPIARPTAKPEPPRSKADEVNASPTTPTRSAAMPTVVTAQVCTALQAWRCEAADSQVPPGLMFFYTQIKSATATTIEHRWYQGDRLRQAVQLRIQANPGAGYRTYSRHTIGSERVGDWRVEVRSADGAVLNEARFTVR